MGCMCSHCQETKQPVPLMRAILPEINSKGSWSPAPEGAYWDGISGILGDRRLPPSIGTRISDLVLRSRCAKPCVTATASASETCGSARSRSTSPSSARAATCPTLSSRAGSPSLPGEGRCRLSLRKQVSFDTCRKNPWCQTVNRRAVTMAKRAMPSSVTLSVLL